MIKKNRPNTCIITQPRTKAGVIPLSNLVDILAHLSNNLYVITGNEGKVVFQKQKIVFGTSIEYKAKNQIVAKIFNYIGLQLKISHEILKIHNRVDVWILFMGEGLILPVITLKLLRKTVLLNLAASSPQMVDADKKRSFISKAAKILEHTNYIISDYIIIYSPNLIQDWNLTKFEKKILIANEHFLNFDVFEFKSKLNQKDRCIGYIGRLREEKGILNFIKAIPIILKINPTSKFLIAGDGPLYGKIKEYLDENNLNDVVKLVGWISHDKVPEYLNNLKLVVLPSYTEGLPNLMLEAMACGTPVLTTSVGMIPEVIKDEKNGFIMETNTPKCIAKNTVRAMEYPDLENIVECARNLVLRNFTYKATFKHYEKIFDDLNY